MCHSSFPKETMVLYSLSNIHSAKIVVHLENEAQTLALVIYAKPFRFFPTPSFQLHRLLYHQRDPTD